MISVTRTAGVCAIALVSATAIGCHAKPVSYQSNVRIQRVVVVSTDAQHSPTSADVSFVWAECPGEQRQTVRSGKALAACLPKLHVGDTVPVTVLWEREDHGGFDWHVVELAGCAIPPVDDDDSSFESIQDCHPSTQHDAVLGFHCDRVPKGELIERCPWFRRE